MKKLIILMHSMRSHETGEYQIMLDSNINIILHQLSVLPKDDEVTVTIPTKRSLDYMLQCSSIVNTFDCKVNWKLLEYGSNAGESREVIDSRLDGIDFDEFDEVESHFCTVKPRKKPNHWTYVIFNSAVPDQVRPYADKHFVTLLRNLSRGYHTVLSCTNQLEFIPMTRAFSTSIETKFFNPKFADSMMGRYFSHELAKTLNSVILPNSIFFPFRVSDKAYRADLVEDLDRCILITDPNDSANKVFTYPIMDLSNYHKCKKTLYMTMLGLLQHRQDIRIPLYEDITKNYHISIVEMLYHCGNNIDFMYGDVDVVALKDKYIL